MVYRKDKDERPKVKPTISMGANFNKKLRLYCLERDMDMRVFLLEMAKRQMENDGVDVGDYDD